MNTAPTKNIHIKFIGNSRPVEMLTIPPDVSSRDVAQASQSDADDNRLTKSRQSTNHSSKSFEEPNSGA